MLTHLPKFSSSIFGSTDQRSEIKNMPSRKGRATTRTRANIRAALNFVALGEQNISRKSSTDRVTISSPKIPSCSPKSQLQTFKKYFICALIYFSRIFNLLFFPLQIILSRVICNPLFSYQPFLHCRAKSDNKIFMSNVQSDNIETKDELADEPNGFSQSKEGMSVHILLELF